MRAIIILPVTLFGFLQSTHALNIRDEHQVNQHSKDKNNNLRKNPSSSLSKSKPDIEKNVKNPEEGAHPSNITIEIPYDSSHEKLGITRPGTQYKLIWNGNWGSWRGWNGENGGGYYACGGEMRFEDPNSGDDTAANGLKLKYCNLRNWSAQRTKTIYNGIWGGWKGMKMCPFGYYVDGAQVRFEDSQGGGDDTALNGLKLRCRKHSGGQVHWITVYGGVWGGWKNMVYISNKYVTLANIRFESSLGGDDTAWNGLYFRYETPNYGISKAPVKGRWSNLASGPIVSTTLVESMESTLGETFTTEQSASISVTISAGFSFAGASGSVSVTGEYSRTTSRSVSSTVTRRQEKSITVACDGKSDTGFWVLWQWVMDQSSDSTGPGFHMSSSQYRCTTNIFKPPKCPLGLCKNNMCQECVGPFSLATETE